MKKTIFQITAITILAISCKKNTPAPGPKSQWTFAGTSYKGFAKSYPLGSEFSASDNLSSIGLPEGNFVAINFFYGYMPAKSGIYKVKENPSDSTQCRVTVGNLGGILLNYTSVDSTSEVNISVSPSGKFSASFYNVVLSSYNRPGTETVSGTLEEQ